jgi:hypothetical protein
VHVPGVSGEEERAVLTLKTLQDEVAVWVEKNFRPQRVDLEFAWRPLLGVGEELGELDHAHLKMVQGIRGDREKHIAAAKDAVGDIVVFLCDYCSAMGFDLQDIVETTWSEVKKRDWKKDPTNGGA